MSSNKQWASWSDYSGAQSTAEGAVMAYDLDSGSSMPQQADDYSVGEWTKHFSSGISNSNRGRHYLLLHEAISRMTLLPVTDPLYVDEATGRYAADLIGLLRGAFDIDAPKVFPQDSEALVLTWDIGDLKRLLTVAGDEVSLLDLHKPSQLRCYYDISDGPAAMPDLIPILMQSLSARSSVED